MEAARIASVRATITGRDITMYETPITVVGRIVTDPRRRDTGNSDVVKFRVASNSRRRADDGSWVTGETLFVNVNCWGRLVTGVAASLKKGDAVIVVGHLYTSEYDDRDGQHRSSLELRATAVGPDLNRYITRLEKHGVPAEPAPGVGDGFPGDRDAETVGFGERCSSASTRPGADQTADGDDGPGADIGGQVEVEVA
ncbi:hypothetical protein MINS_34060 [Mycolicibacterium insubricum]|jgi:single-strand DNA-binding protein|nr:hypothetical protein MINS_34060 [Mycolicibacterium insubricum]